MLSKSINNNTLQYLSNSLHTKDQLLQTSNQLEKFLEIQKAAKKKKNLLCTLGSKVETKT